jgi:hypothetical protein
MLIPLPNQMRTQCRFAAVHRLHFVKDCAGPSCLPRASAAFSIIIA